jgi:hypothetical protein
MTESDLTFADHLIADRFTAIAGDEGSPSWFDVRRRAHLLGATESRPRKRLILAAALVAAIALPAVAVAGFATGLLPGFQGQPAPLSVQEKITQLAAQDLSGRLVALGVRASEAKGVLAMKTDAGTVRVWVAPTATGEVCSLFQIDNAGVQSLTCGLAELDAPLDLEVAHLKNGVILIDGRVNADAKSIALRLEDGSEHAVPIVDGHFATLATTANQPQSFVLDGARGVSVFPVPTDKG